MLNSYKHYQYGLSDAVLSILIGLGQRTTDTLFLEDLEFACHVNVTADGLSEWLKITLTFDELLEELVTYHLAKPAEDSVVSFCLYPFLDDCELWTYSLHLYNPDYTKQFDTQTCISIQTLQNLL